MDILDYVQPIGPLPDIAMTKTGRVLVVGTAACVWDDLRAINNNRWNGDRIAVNNAAAFPDYIGRIDHIVTMHPEFLPQFCFPHQFRYAKNGIPMPVTHSKRKPIEYGQPILMPDYVWSLTNRGHCSGLFAVLLALLMGYEEVVLAGSPVDSSGKFCGPPAEKTICDTPGLQTVWQEVIALLKGRVTSLSGNTRKWYGAP